jgi:hypothetical protein
MPRWWPGRMTLSQTAWKAMRRIRPKRGGISDKYLMVGGKCQGEFRGRFSHGCEEEVRRQKAEVLAGIRSRK